MSRSVLRGRRFGTSAFRALLCAVAVFALTSCDIDGSLHRDYRAAWSAGVDSYGAWMPTLSAGGSTTAVSWRSAKGLRSRVTIDGPLWPGGRGDNAQVAVSVSGDRAWFSNAGVATGSGGIFMTSGDSAHPTRVTFARGDVSAESPTDFFYPTMWASSSAAPWWISTNYNPCCHDQLSTVVEGRATVVAKFKEVFSVTISPDHSTLAVAGSEARGNSLVVVDLSTRQLTRYFTGQGVVAVSLANGGHRGFVTIKPAYAKKVPDFADRLEDQWAAKGGVFKWNETTLERVPGSMGTAQPWEVVSSPDGAHVLALGNSKKPHNSGWREQLWLSAHGEPLRLITPSAQNAGAGAVFSPDSRSVAYGYDGQLFVRNIGSRRSERISAPGTVAWSDEGSLSWNSAGLAYISNANSVLQPGRLSLWRYKAGSSELRSTRPASWR